MSDDEQGPSRERVRVRRSRRSRKRAPGHRWWWVPVLGGVVVLVAIAAVLFVRDASTVRSALLETRTSLGQVQSALGDVDVAEASRALDEADESLGVARSRVSGPLWTMIGLIPVAGDSVDVTRAVVDVGTAALDVAHVAVTEGEELVGGGLDVRVTDGQVDLEPLAEAQEVLASMPLQRLRDARARLSEADPRWAPQEVLDGREETLALADDALEVADRADALLEALPGFLGVDGPRRYFLGVQTPAEARGTGGLIGYWAVLQVDDGQFTLSEAGVYDALVDLAAGDDEAEGDAAGAVTSRIGELGGDPWDGVPTTQEFEERYAHTAAPGFFSNVNVDPDLPTTARVALDLFHRRTEERLDGMILVDPIAMQMVLEAIGGPLEIPPGLAAPDVPDELAPSEFAEFVLVDIYDVYGHGHSSERTHLLRGLGDLAFARVFDGAWDGVAVSQAIADAGARRHLQVFSESAEEQAAFSRVRVTGELSEPQGHDLLAVTINNAVGGKQDVHLGHTTQATVELSRPRFSGDDTVVVTRDSTVRIQLDNPLPASGMDTYIIGNCLVGDERNRCFEGPPGWNRTWFSVWTPGGDTLEDRRRADGIAPVRVGDFHGLRVIDHYLETPPEGTEWFELDLSGTVPATHSSGTLTYRLDWWRQSKAIPDLLDITLVPPDGWEVVEVEVTGGGDGRGMGVHGGGVPLTAEVTGEGRGTVVGTVTQDTSIEVQMRRTEE